MSDLAVPLDHSRARADNDRMFLIAVAVIAVVQIWFGMIGSSLWLDETGTWWIVKDGPAQAVHRALTWSGQSPFYYLIAWLSSRVFGLNEIALRLPSVFAMGGAIFFLYRIAERIYDRATAFFTALIFLLAASFYTVDARPYALSQLCLTASVWALIMWVETCRARYAIGYVIAAAALLYAHVIMGLALAPVAIYGVAALWKQWKRLALFGAMQLTILAGFFPVVGELRSFYATRSAHTFHAAPTKGDIALALIPCSLLGGLILTAWVVQYLRREVDDSADLSNQNILLVAAWAFFAPVVLFLLPLIADLHLFVDRYYSSALPGQALLLAILVRSIRKTAARNILLGAAAVLSIIAMGRMTNVSHGGEDWKRAMPWVRAQAGDAPVLLVSGFIEASDFDKLRSPELQDVLFAPELLYGEPRRPIRLPNVFSGSDSKDMEAVVAQLSSAPKFYLLTEDPSKNYELWLRGRLGAACVSEPSGQDFGSVWVTRFTCKR